MGFLESFLFHFSLVSVPTLLKLGVCSEGFLRNFLNSFPRMFCGVWVFIDRQISISFFQHLWLYAQWSAPTSYPQAWTRGNKCKRCQNLIDVWDVRKHFIVVPIFGKNRVYYYRWHLSYDNCCIWSMNSLACLIVVHLKTGSV